MITFAHPELLFLLALLPLWLFVRGRTGGAPAIRYSSTKLAAAAARSVKRRLLGFLPLLRIPAAALFILALAQPELGHASTKIDASGIDILLAVDVSSSMEAHDMGSEQVHESRLEAVKKVVAKFIEARPNDRIGLIAFAGAPYLVSPLTLDHDWLVQSLARLQTGIVEDGTAIGSALATSVDRVTDDSDEGHQSGSRSTASPVRLLDGGPSDSRIVVLLTDGVNNSGVIQPSLAAETAKTMGVKVYAIGVGVDGEAMIPVRDRDGATRMVRTNVEVDEDTLRQIAETTGGSFFRATDTASLANVYAEIDHMETTTRTIERFESFDQRYAMFLLPGIGLLGLELLLGFGLRRRIP